MGGVLGHREPVAATQVGRVIWSDQALDDLEEIGRYIAGFNPAAAVRLLIRLRAAGESLRDFPDRGRPAFVGTRELTSMSPYVIRYWVEADEVVIVRVRHGARRPEH